MSIIIMIFIILVVSFIYRGYKNTHSVEINHINIETDPQLNDGTSVRILHISDMHIENISITPDQLFENLRDQSFDIIALTGDFLDRKRSIPKLKPYLQVLSQLKPAYGAYAVFGNHDYVLRAPSFNQLKEMLNEFGFKTLQNENEMIDVDGKAINIIGIDDFSTNHSNLSKSYNGLEKGYNLVFTHDPNIVLKMADYHFDYLLSGHFHGGQIHWPKPYHLLKMGKLVRMNMVKGLHQYNNRQFYISEGLGQTGINIRVGSRPEITIHNLHLHQQKKVIDRIEFEDSTTIAG
jgi:predicted MPP superfamily phosphohydrolase